MRRTLNNNLISQLSSIEFSRLSQTFKDAIVATRNLGIKYLWIDSLCITQDNAEDWAREAAHMGTIFENSTCTLAVIDAIDELLGTDQGLFIPRIKDPLSVHMTCVLETELVTDGSESGEPTQVINFLQRHGGEVHGDSVREALKLHKVIARPRLLGGHSTVLKSKWNYRGWILQERILSRRIIYYTKKKLFWDCNSHAGEEENLGVNETPLRAGWLEKSVVPWQSLVEDYTQCHLTKDADKLTAMLGLSERLEKRTGRKCHAGIFEDQNRDFGECLLWKANGLDSLKRYPHFHALSWSWTAYGGPVSYYTHNMDPATSYPLISKPVFMTQSQCNVPGCTSLNGTCVRGSVSFCGPVGGATTSGQLEEWSLKNEDLIHTLGSAVHWRACQFHDTTSTE
jgi:hypothetical protein